MEQTGYELSLAEAQALAVREGWREKVLVYVTRGHSDRGAQLLVFEEQPGLPEVPAGGVEPGEHPAQTAVRETLEESGLALSGPVHLASYHWTRAGASQVWHYYWLQAPADTPDAWTHIVTGAGNDQGERLSYRFAPLHPDSLLPGHRFETALPTLLELLRQKAPA